MKQLFLPIICITFTTIVLKYLIKLRHKKRHKILEEDLNAQYYHQCNFINMKQFNCRPHLLEVKECGDFCSLVYEKEIRSLIASAKISVCICMYIISLKEVIFALIRASRRGVEVRVITDKVMLKTDVMQRNFAKLKNLGKFHFLDMWVSISLIILGFSINYPAVLVFHIFCLFQTLTVFHSQ